MPVAIAASKISAVAVSSAVSPNDIVPRTRRGSGTGTPPHWMLESAGDVIATWFLLDSESDGPGPSFRAPPWDDPLWQSCVICATPCAEHALMPGFERESRGDGAAHGGHRLRLRGTRVCIALSGTADPPPGWGVRLEGGAASWNSAPATAP